MRVEVQNEPQAIDSVIHRSSGADCGMGHVVVEQQGDGKEESGSDAGRNRESLHLDD